MKPVDVLREEFRQWLLEDLNRNSKDEEYQKKYEDYMEALWRELE